MGVWLGASVIKVSALFFMVTWGLETTFNLKGLKWKLAVSTVFLGIAFMNTRGITLRMELFFMEGNILLPFASVWILTLWGVSHWKNGRGV